MRYSIALLVVVAISGCGHSDNAAATPSTSNAPVTAGSSPAGKGPAHAVKKIGTGATATQAGANAKAGEHVNSKGGA